MSYVGGLRARLIHSNIYNVINDGLDELGWLDTGQQHRDVVVRSSQVGREEKIEPNVVCVTVEDVKEVDLEMGSNLAEHIWAYYIDVYAENNALGLHLATDIRDILQGRYTSTVTRSGPNITILDLSTGATPSELFHVEIEGVDMNRSRFYEKPFQEHWWVISFAVVDSYATEEDS